MGQKGSRCCQTRGNVSNTTHDALVPHGETDDTGDAGLSELNPEIFGALKNIDKDVVSRILKNKTADVEVTTQQHMIQSYYNIIWEGANASSVYDAAHEAIASEDKSEDDKLRAIGSWYDSLMFGIDIHKHQGAQVPCVKKPIRELFLQSLMFHMTQKDVALLLLQFTESPIASALIGYGMLNNLALLANRENEYDLEDKSTELAEKLESIAVEAINACYKKDIEKAIFLVIRSLPEWNNSTLMSIAEGANSKRFMATNACQARLTQIWTGYFYFSNTSDWKMWLSSVLPLFALKERNHIVEQKEPDAPNNNWEKNKHEKDPWYPTTKGILRRGLNEDRFGCSAPLWFLHSTPRVKLITHSISYVVYLTLFSFFVNTNLAPVDKQKPGAVEYMVWILSFSLLLDEIRQILNHSPQDTQPSWKSYFKRGWNWLDLTVHVLMLISLILHLTLTQENFHVVRDFYAIALYISFLRIIHIFYASTKVGPMVIMIRDMVTDLIVFLIIMIVFVLAYGVTVRALKYPNVSPSWSLITDIIYEPYWSVYGETFGGDNNEVIAGVFHENCTFNETLHRLMPDSYPRCPEHSWLAVILFAFYLIIVNVLLLNLLVAIFSNTYDRIQGESDNVWRFHRYQFVVEYYEKPSLPPPFIIFSHIFTISKLIQAKFQGKRTKTKKKNNAFYHDMAGGNPKVSNKDLSELARDRIIQVMYEKDEQETNDEVKLGTTISKLQSTVDAVKKDVEEMKMTSLYPASTEGLSSPDNINRRLTSVEEGFKGVNSRIVALDSKLDNILQIIKR